MSTGTVMSTGVGASVDVTTSAGGVTASGCEGVSTATTSAPTAASTGGADGVDEHAASGSRQVTREKHRLRMAAFVAWNRVRRKAPRRPAGESSRRRRYPAEVSASSPIPRDALGLALRAPYYDHLFARWPEVDYFEAISENFMGDRGPALRRLDAVRRRYPVVLHGVGMNLLGHAPLDEDHLDELCRLADRVDAPFVSDHLCWTGARGVSHHDLLPAPYVPELVELAAERAAHVQRRLGRPFGLENLSSYVEFERSTLSEWEFYTRVVRDAGCWFMLDVNNVFVSSQNHGFDPATYLSAVDFNRVLQVHLAGHSVEADGTLVDTHDQPVTDAVWALYADAWRRGGPFPTLLEWDERIPPLPDALAELARAKGARA